MSSVKNTLDELLRKSINVEALAQQLARYIQISSEDSEYLGRDPTRRDQLIAQLSTNSGTELKLSVESLVKFGEDPDKHLNALDAEIDKLTPPKSLEDRIARSRLAVIGAIVFQHYKLSHALLDFGDVRDKEGQLMTDLMDNWHKTKLPILFPDPVEPLNTSAQAPSSAPQNGPLSSASGGSHKPTSRKRKRPITYEDQIEMYLNKPSTLRDGLFKYNAPPGAQDSELTGITWWVGSYEVDFSYDVEYVICFEEESFRASGEPIRGDSEKLRYYLEHSEPVDL